MLKLSLALLLLLCSTTPLAAEWEPWDAAGKPRQTSGLTSEIDPLQQTVNFFQKYISPVDGARCPMYPTCSAYAKQALSKHGPFIGLMMTVDRLYRESDPLEKQEQISRWGVSRAYDPLDNNDFWWLPQRSRP